jgi:hypothetical protein
MTRENLDQYQRLLLELDQLCRERSALIAKLKAKRFSKNDAERLPEVIRLVNRLEAQRTKLEKENPLRPENILKAMRADHKE